MPDDDSPALADLSEEERRVAAVLLARGPKDSTAAEDGPAAAAAADDDTPLPAFAPPDPGPQRDADTPLFQAPDFGTDNLDEDEY